MFTKKFFIIAIVGLVLILGIGFVLFFGKKSATQNQQQTTTGQTSTTTGTGNFVAVSAGPTYDLRGNLIVKTDPTQPFVSVAPRAQSQQPNKLAQTQTGSSLQFQDYNQALNNGLIPDQNGMYKQVVNTSGFSPAETQQYNYALPDSQFLQTYYPGANALLNSGNPSSPSNITQGTDSLAVLPSDPTAVVDIVPGVDPTLFKTTTADDNASLMNYIKQMSAITSAFDLYNNQTTVSNVLLNDTNVDVLNSYKSQAKAVQDQITALTVPQGLLGLAQAYYQAYADYQSFVDLAISLSGDNSSGQNLLTQPTSSSGQTQATQADPNSYVNLTSALSDLDARVKEAVSYVNNRQ